MSRASEARGLAGIVRCRVDQVHPRSSPAVTSTRKGTGRLPIEYTPQRKAPLGVASRTVRRANLQTEALTDPVGLDLEVEDPRIELCCLFVVVCFDCAHLAQFKRDSLALVAKPACMERLAVWWLTERHKRPVLCSITAERLPSGREFALEWVGDLVNGFPGSQILVVRLGTRSIKLVDVGLSGVRDGLCERGRRRLAARIPANRDHAGKCDRDCRKE